MQVRGRDLPAHASRGTGPHRRGAAGRLRPHPQRAGRRRQRPVALHQPWLRHAGRCVGRRGLAPRARHAAQVCLRARLARLLPPCLAAPRRWHLAIAARGPSARRRLRPRAAGRHPPGLHRRAGGRRSGACALRYRHAAQPRPHVAGQLRGACAQGALALWRRLVVWPPARRRSGQQPPQLAMGGWHRQWQALPLQCRQRGPLCTSGVAQPWQRDRRQLRGARSHRVPASAASAAANRPAARQQPLRAARWPPGGRATP